MKRPSEAKDVSLAEIKNRFGYLLRRSYQTTKARLENSPDNSYELTSTQHSILTVICDRELIDQASIAELLALDRTTTGLAIKNLEKKKLITRVASAADKRRKLVALSETGHHAISDIQIWASAMHAEFDIILNQEEQYQLRQLLKKLIDYSEASA